MRGCDGDHWREEGDDPVHCGPLVGIGVCDRLGSANAGPMKPRRTKIYFDGGCRPNPGVMEIAVVIGGVATIDRAAGTGSSMDAEWLALIAALRIAQARGLSDFVLLGDAAAVVAQANSRVAARHGAAAHLAVFRGLVGDGPAPRVRHVKRSQNLAGIALARL